MVFRTKKLVTQQKKQKNKLGRLVGTCPHFTSGIFLNFTVIFFLQILSLASENSLHETRNTHRFRVNKQTVLNVLFDSSTVTLQLTDSSSSFPKRASVFAFSESRRLGSILWPFPNLTLDSLGTTAATTLTE